MLSRRLRLPRAGFDSLQGAFRATSVHFSLSYSKAPHAAAAAIVSKDVAKRSVDRHRLRRRILVVLRPFMNQSHILVVRAKKGAPLLPFEVLKQELEGLIGRAYGQSKLQ